MHVYQVMEKDFKYKFKDPQIAKNLIRVAKEKKLRTLIFIIRRLLMGCSRKKRR